jgi:glycosyl transferase/beta-hydroxylase protein BlmF
VSKVYVIATAHDAYRQRVFEPGSVVIDPWRMIPDQKDVTVKRLGENKPALISLLVPSRGRPDSLHKMVYSAFSNATHQRRIEVVAYLDEDDPRLFEYDMQVPCAVHVDLMKNVRLGSGPRMLLSESWNYCFKIAKGEILMHCGDDLLFITHGWDQMVRDAFAAIPDRIGLVYGDDLSTNFPELATHGFLHRRWVETVGYFLPPLFSCDWNDVWISEVATKLDRLVPLPDMVIEHQHYSFDKREHDATDREREERGAADDVVGLFKRTAPERLADVEKLRKVMA